MDAYTKIRKLGEGSYGCAYLIKCKADGKQFVSKEIRLGNKSLREKEDARKEVALLAQLNHPNIVGYITSFEESGSLYIIMEFCDAGDLYSRIMAQKGQPFSEDQVVTWFAQLALAIKHCHDRKILHRDIKSQNVFVTSSGQLKLGDFGIAKALDSTFALARTCIGTPYYLSPEICENRSYNNKSDIWALGCILYELATLRHAFEGNSMQQLVTMILRGKPPLLPARCSADLRQMVNDIFQRNPRDRPSVNNILRRPFISRRLSTILGEAKYSEEFSHTILHGLQLKKKLPPNGPASAATPQSAVSKAPSSALAAAAAKRPSQPVAQPQSQAANRAVPAGPQAGPDAKKARAAVTPQQQPPKLVAGAKPPVGAANANAGAGEYRRNVPAPTPSNNAQPGQANAQYLRQQAAKLAGGAAADRQRVAVAADRDRVSSNSPAAAGNDNARPSAEKKAPAGRDEQQYAQYLQFIEKGQRDQADRERAINELKAAISPAPAGAVANAKPAGGNLIVQQVGMGINRPVLSQNRQPATPAQANINQPARDFIERRREAEQNRLRNQAALKQEALNVRNVNAEQSDKSAAEQPVSGRPPVGNESEYVAQLRRIRMQNLHGRQAQKLAENRSSAAARAAQIYLKPPVAVVSKPTSAASERDRPSTADALKAAAAPAAKQPAVAASTPSLTAAFEAIGGAPRSADEESNQSSKSPGSSSEVQRITAQKKRQSILKRLNNKKDAVQPDEDSSPRSQWTPPDSANPINPNRWVAPGQSFVIKERTFVLEQPEEAASEPASQPARSSRKAWQANPSSTVLQKLRDIEPESLFGSVLGEKVDAQKQGRQAGVEGDSASAAPSVRIEANKRNDDEESDDDFEMTLQLQRLLLEQQQDENGEKDQPSSEKKTSKDQFDSAKRPDSKQIGFGISTGRFDIDEPKLLRTCSLPRLDDAAADEKLVTAIAKKQRSDSVSEMDVDLAIPLSVLEPKKSSKVPERPIVKNFADDDGDGDDLFSVRESMRLILSITDDDAADLQPIVVSPPPAANEDSGGEDEDDIAMSGKKEDENEDKSSEEDDDEYFEEQYEAVSRETIFSQIEQLKVEFERALGLDRFLEVYHAFQSLATDKESQQQQGLKQEADENRRDRYILLLLKGDVEQYDRILQMIVSEAALAAPTS